jgi:hypothetical protein
MSAATASQLPLEVYTKSLARWELAGHGVANIPAWCTVLLPLHFLFPSAWVNKLL